MEPHAKQTDETLLAECDVDTFRAGGLADNTKIKRNQQCGWSIDQRGLSSRLETLEVSTETANKHFNNCEQS